MTCIYCIPNQTNITNLTDGKLMIKQQSKMKAGSLIPKQDTWESFLQKIYTFKIYGILFVKEHSYISVEGNPYTCNLNRRLSYR